MSEAINPTPATPPDRTLSGELKPLSGYINRYTEQAAGNQLSYTNAAAAQVPGFYSALAGAERGATTKQRKTDVSDLGKFGPQFQQEAESLVPQWQQSLGTIGGQLGQIGGQTPLQGQLATEATNLPSSPLLGTLNQQAGADLALGRSLSPEQEREALQTSRAGFAARGMDFSNPAVASDVLSRDAAATQRYYQRQQEGETVLGLDYTQQQANRGFQLSAEQAAQQQLQGERGFTLGAAGQTQQAAGATLGWFNQRAPSPAIASSFYQPQNTMGVGAGLLGYGSDLYNTNYNASAAANIAQANNAAAFRAALLSATGSIAGAACWVARAIYGDESEDWRTFKQWLDYHAPAWFAALYANYGERFANFIRTKPRAKRWIKPFFDRKVKWMNEWIDKQETDRLVVPARATERGETADDTDDTDKGAANPLYPCHPRLNSSGVAAAPAMPRAEMLHR